MQVLYIYNIRGKALFLAMMDFTPQLEATQILQENLDTYCRIVDGDMTVDEVEVAWATKIINVFRNLQKRDIPLSVRHKDVLAPLNLDENYDYCLGNRSIKHSLRKLNECKFAKQQSIRKMTNAGSAIPVIEMIKRLKERHDQETQRRQQRLEQAAAVEQQQQDDEADGGGGRGGRQGRSCPLGFPVGRPAREQTGSCGPRPQGALNTDGKAADKGQQLSRKRHLDTHGDEEDLDDVTMPEMRVEMPNTDLPDDIPPASEEFVSLLRSDPSSSLTIRNKDTEVTMPLASNTMISITPGKRSRGILCTETPDKVVDAAGKARRLQNLTNVDKIELLGEFIRKGFI